MEVYWGVFPTERATEYESRQTGEVDIDSLSDRFGQLGWFVWT